MTYCRLCVMPSARPDLHLDQDGVCDACRWAAQKRSVSWGSREVAWTSLVNWARREAAARRCPYDCAIGVSGGKDSTFIVATALRYGLHPLGVNFEPSEMTPLGQRNLDNLSSMCDVIQVKKNADVYRRLRQIGLREVGDSEWPNHLGIFSSVLREAVLRRIPLVLFGENPQAEYAGPAWSKDPKPLDAAWIAEFGGLLGMRLSDMERKGFEPLDLAPYRCPDAVYLHQPGLEIRSIFLGDYFFWDTVKQAALARDEHGFQWAPAAPTGAYWPFENLDDVAAVTLHDYLGYRKYGYTRAHAQLSVEIRHGYQTRAGAVEILAIAPMQIVAPYAACASLGVPYEEVCAVCERFTNLAIFGNAKATLPKDPIWTKAG